MDSNGGDNDDNDGDLGDMRVLHGATAASAATPRRDAPATHELALRIEPQSSSSSTGSTSVTATSSTVGSIFAFHPSLQRKNAATPRATTPRNLVFPEPSSSELSVAQAHVYTPIDANRFSNAAQQEESDQDVHRRNRQAFASNVPLSARKYLTPRQDDDPPAVQPMASPESAQHQHRRLAVIAPPRNLRGKIQFYCLRALQSIKPSCRAIRLLHRQLHFQQKIAYVLILCGMLSESATPAPRYNVPIGIAVFTHSTSRFDHRVVVSGLCLAILVDFVWLLRPQEGSFNGYFRVQYDNFTHACLGLCSLIKVWLVFSTYSDLGPEPLAHASGADAEQQAIAATRPHHRLWHHVKFFFPRKTYPRCSHLSFEVLMRTLALVWIHGLCGVALLVLGIVSAMFYTGKVQFRSMAFGAPLHLMMIIRATTTLATYFVATQHMSYHGCLKLFGCHRLAAMDEGEDGSDIVLKYNKRWLQRMQRVKAVDALAGVYFVLVFYSAFHSGQFFAGSGLTAVLVITGVVVLVLDFWTPLLIMVVAKCGALLHAHHKRGTVDIDPYYPNQLEWEDANDDASDSSSSSDSDSSSSGGRSSSSRGSSSDSSLSSTSSGGYSTSASRIRRQRSRRLRRRAKREARRAGSRKPLLSHSSRRDESLPIVDAHKVLSSRVLDSAEQQQQRLLAATSPVTSSRTSGGIWVRHWHEASGRSYLVHSITGESVWEIMNAAKTPKAKQKAKRTKSRGGDDGSSDSSSDDKPKRSGRKFSPRGTLGSARRSASSNRELTPTSGRARAPAAGGDDGSGSPPTSDSEVVVTTVPSPRATGGNASARMSARRSSHLSFHAPGESTAPAQGDDIFHAPTDDNMNAPCLTPHEFLLLWDALLDGGSFTCRVSRIPSLHDLARHLLRNGFVVASDGLGHDNVRTVHFYAPVVVDDAPSSSSGRHSARLASSHRFFLGAFVFDSLSLKLHATFRCAQQDAIVPFVKKLQLKEIVGSYAPCD